MNVYSFDLHIVTNKMACFLLYNKNSLGAETIRNLSPNWPYLRKGLEYVIWQAWVNLTKEY